MSLKNTASMIQNKYSHKSSNKTKKDHQKVKPALALLYRKGTQTEFRRLKCITLCKLRSFLFVNFSNDNASSIAASKDY